ncbi:MBL fold metallo-hydrolase [Paenibacillus hamazuiensis]|uniref:MBL fold metallo-hydrolase n=1 Tax=Paenibacillus hamazuiensis TaxID=2936508 RepID=UPI00200EBF80|nr:MBL fold metallo-hydrolase [Paenibacillus hamazuiensis]
MINIAVWGGAGEHGRSSYFIQKDRLRVLLDCGVKKEGAGQYPAVDAQEAAALDAVFLSHAHEDHSMAIPLLYKLGYRGLVWTTRATAEQLPGYFAAWKKYVVSRSAELPYGEEHIDSIRFAFLEERVDAGEWLTITPSLKVMWGRSGHLAGSVWLLLDMDGSLVFFSGDYSRESCLLAADWPELAGRQVELAIVDAACGMDEESQELKLSRLQETVAETAARGGTVLLPVPVYGRGQDLLVWLRETFPQLPVIAEADILGALERMLAWPDWLRPQAERCIREVLADGLVREVRDREERERLIGETGPRVILTSDGMMQSAKAQWYYRELSRNPAAASVVLTGHLAAGSFGDALLKSKSADGCRAELIRYKVHQGIRDVREMLDAVDSKETLLVHAGKASTDLAAAHLAQLGYKGIHSLECGDRLVTGGRGR